MLKKFWTSQLCGALKRGPKRNTRSFLLKIKKKSIDSTQSNEKIFIYSMNILLEPTVCHTYYFRY